jgi:hypothetical protein
MKPGSGRYLRISRAAMAVPIIVNAPAFVLKKGF